LWGAEIGLNVECPGQGLQLLQISASSVSLGDQKFYHQVIFELLVNMPPITELVQGLRIRIGVFFFYNPTRFQVKTNMRPGIAMEHMEVPRDSAPPIPEAKPPPSVNTSKVIVDPPDV
jgi:hypothetical protein